MKWYMSLLKIIKHILLMPLDRKFTKFLTFKNISSRFLLDHVTQAYHERTAVFLERENELFCSSLHAPAECGPMCAFVGQAANPLYPSFSASCHAVAAQCGPDRSSSNEPAAPVGVNSRCEYAVVACRTRTLEGGKGIPSKKKW